MAKDKYLRVFHEEPLTGWSDSGASGAITLPADHMESLGVAWRGQNRQHVRLSAGSLFSGLLERLVWWSRFRVTPTLGRIRCRLLLLAEIPLCGLWKSESIRAKSLPRVIQFRDGIVARGARLTSLSAHGRNCVRRTWNPHWHESGQCQAYEGHAHAWIQGVPLSLLTSASDRA